MTLTLRIENFDQLDDGGPLWLSVDQRGASVGRSRSMDWILPDPSRMISGHHFDVTYQNGAYWLTDVSMNGTFLHGQRYRLEGAHQIRPGDRFAVGHYIILAEMAGAGMPVAPQQQAPDFAPETWSQAPVDDDDPWAFAPEFDTPVNPQGRRQVNAFDDVGQSFIPLQRPDNPEVPNVPRPAPRMAPGGMPQTHQPPAPPQPVPAGPGRADILRAFCEGAGLQLSDVADVDAEQLALELGHTVRAVAEETMRMLRDRANVKQFTRGGTRTMRSATGNNPLKFMPDETQALDALFLRRQDGFVAGAEGVRGALADIREHQIAVFAALQPALARVLEGLSPEEIESAAGDSKVLTPGGKRRRAWDQFVARWDEKARRGDHGMLDAFLEAFARAYQEALSARHK